MVKLLIVKFVLPYSSDGVAPLLQTLFVVFKTYPLVGIFSEEV